MERRENHRRTSSCRIGQVQALPAVLRRSFLASRGLMPRLGLRNGRLVVRRPARFDAARATIPERGLTGHCDDPNGPYALRTITQRLCEIARIPDSVLFRLFGTCSRRAASQSFLLRGACRHKRRSRVNLLASSSPSQRCLRHCRCLVFAPHRRCGEPSPSSKRAVGVRGGLAADDVKAGHIGGEAMKNISL